MKSQKTLPPSPHRKAISRTLLYSVMTAALIGGGCAWAQDTSPTATASGDIATNAGIGIDQVSTFLFLTLGPLKILGPFAKMTRGLPEKSKRTLALQGTVIATLGALAAVFLGTNMIQKWGVTTGALLIAAGIVLFLVALQAVMNQFTVTPPLSPETASNPTGETATPDISALDISTLDISTLDISTLAFAPLAFPTIITPYGVAVLIVLMTLRDKVEYGLYGILGILFAVLLSNLVAMLFADRLLKLPFVPPALGILGAVLGILQVALGIQAIVAGMRLLHMIPGA